MSARSAIEIALYCGLLPAVAALAVYLAIGWLLPENGRRRYCAGAAFALAVFTGFASAPTSKSIVPVQFWDWVPYLGMLAAIAAGVTLADGISRVERWTIVVLTAALTAWMIVPTWDQLTPARPILVAALAVGIAALALLVEPLAGRLPGRALAFWLMLAAGTCAALILAEVSEMFGRLAALPASALAGCGVAAWLTKRDADWRGLVLPYAVVVGGFAFVGMIYPSPPLVPLLLVPLVPLVLWLRACGPLARLGGWRAPVAEAICVLMPLGVIVALVLMRSAGDEW